MSNKICTIQALGTRGKVKGKLFTAVPQDRGYVLHSEDLAAKSGKALRFAINKVYVHSIDEVAELLIKGGFHIRLYNAEHKQWNLRAPSEVEIISFE